MNNIEIKNVTKKYDGFLFVKISFNVPAGSIVGLIGENGAGKTTTFRMIIGLLEPTEGKITLDGKPIDYSVTDTIGFLTEERSLLTKLTVKEQIIYYGTLKGMEEKEILERLDEWLERFHIKEYKDRKIKELSKGNKQKIQFIISILHDPDLIILDEPFSGLDPVSVEYFKNVILELKEKGKTIIFSSHVMSQVEMLCEDVLIIDKGKVILNCNLNDIKHVNLVFEGICDNCQKLNKDTF